MCVCGGVACREKLEGRWTTFPISRLAVLDAHLSLKRLKSKLKSSGHCWAFSARLNIYSRLAACNDSPRLRWRGSGWWWWWGGERQGKGRRKSVKGRKYREERGEEKGDGGQRGGKEIRERLEVDGGVVGGGR